LRLDARALRGGGSPQCVHAIASAPLRPVGAPQVGMPHSLVRGLKQRVGALTGAAVGAAQAPAERS
jgi:hypothetical protein